MQPRHLQHMSIEAFYGLYQLWCAGNQYQDDNVAKALPRCLRRSGSICSVSVRYHSMQGIMITI